MLVADLDIWPNIIEIGEEESELEMAKNWNIDRGRKQRGIMNRQTI